MATVHPIAPRPLIARVADGLANLKSRLGTSADRNTQSVYFVDQMGQQQIEAAYRSSWLTRKVHDLVPFEMTRANRDWQADAPQIEAIEALEAQIGLWDKLATAARTARLHGGAAIIMGVNGNPAMPLRVETLGTDSLRYLAVVSRHQITVGTGGMDRDPTSDSFGGPLLWQMNGANGAQVQIHPSRVVTFHGAPLAPGSVGVAEIDQFWGDPLLHAIKAAIDNAETSQAAVATLLHEMKYDTISIPGLTEQIATEGSEARLAARIEAVATFRSMFNVTLLDGGEGGTGGETWETRQLSFAQMPELIDQFVGLVAGAADIPKTRLMGASPGGMNSTGKGEQDDFNRMIDARRKAEFTGPLLKIDEVLLRSALGSRPAEITYVFGPLDEGNAKEAAEIEKLEADTVVALTGTGHIPSAAMAKAVVNRMTESGRWPGLDVSDGDIDVDQAEAEVDAAEQLQAANENTALEMEQRGQVTRDQAMTLITDASPRSLYVERRLLNVGEVSAWAKAQGFGALDDELHVTIAHSRTPVDWFAAGGDGWGGDDKGEITVPPGGPRMVERLGPDGAVVLLFANSSLGWRHEEIKRAGAVWDHPDYSPHVTLTYTRPAGLDLAKVEPYRGALRFGPERFSEVRD